MNEPLPKAVGHSEIPVKPMLRGVNHMALTTEDMKMTTDFYCNVLGLPLVHAMKVPPGVGTGPGNRGNPPYEEIRHYFWDMGNDSLLGFFEIPKGVKKQADRDDIGGMQHLAFAASAENFVRMTERLRAHGVAVDGPIRIFSNNIFSIYFFDPNGIRLEICCKTDQADEQRVLEAFAQSREGARAELATLTGDAAWIERMTAAFS